MSKPKHIKYYYSGEADDVKKTLRQFSTNEVLKRINIESTSLFQEKPKTDFPAARYISYTVTLPTGLSKQEKSILTAWNLVDLAYYIIFYSNDYRGKPIEHNEELYMLYDAVKGMHYHNEIDYIKNAGYVKKFLYLWGFAGEQFKMESIKAVLENAGRELYILFESSKNVPKFQVDIGNIVIEESGFCWQKIICALFIGWAYFMNKGEYKTNTIAFKENSPLTEKEYQQILQKYTCTYDEVRNSPLKRQIFYTKPYIKTQRGELIGISPFLDLALYEHCIYWIVRSYYEKQDSQNFTSYFGLYFEAYLKELLNDCLNLDEFEKIPEGKTSRADWKLTIGDNKFIIEQKSAFIRLAVKQQESNVAFIEDFAKKTIIRALNQLQNTESEFNDGRYVKIILLYDDYLKPEFLDQVFDMPECTVFSDKYYWIVSIEELELLLPLRKTNRELFEHIITEKINREITHSNMGRSLGQILRENDITANEYLEKDKFLNYKLFAQNEMLNILNH